MGRLSASIQSAGETGLRPLAPHFLATAALAILFALVTQAAAAASFTLTVSPVPTGGRVTSSPAGINCGGALSPGTACSAPFVGGSPVTMTATPDRFLSFIEWTSAVATSTANPLVQAMPLQNFTLTARFGTRPGAPAIGTAVPGNGRAAVSFGPPASDGGSPIVSYVATASPGGASATGPASPIVVTGLANGTPYTFTVRATNQVGTGTASAASNSVTPSAPTVIRTLDAGMSHTLAVSASGLVFAWGENSSGALGDGTRANSSVPVRSGNLTGVVAVSAGRDLSIALRDDGTVWTWGTGSALGTGTQDTCFNRPCSLSPGPVPGLAGVTAIAASGGGNFALALMADRTVKAWGSNASGMLGIGSTVDSSTPVTVANLSDVVAIAAGHSHAVALKADGTVMAWGTNRRGELGVVLPNTAQYLCDTFACAKTPVPVMAVRLGTVPLSEVASIASKGRHTLALRTDGTVWAWGSNYYGQLGDGTDTDRDAPVRVATLSGITSIAAGFSHSLAMQGTTYWAWGLNLSARLGLGLALVENCVARLIGGFTSDYQLGDTWPCKRLPSLSSARNGATAIVGGGAHTLAVRPGGDIEAFGLNNYGQTGVAAVRTFVGPFCYADPGSCPGSPQGASASSTSISRASASGALNVNSIDDGLDFGSQPFGTASAAIEMRITNIGRVTLGIPGIDTSGDFSQASNCGGAALPTEAYCSVYVTFMPAGFGTRTGTLTIRTDDAASPTAVLALSGSSPGVALDVAKSGAGSGTITSSPAGIDCGPTCSAQFAPNARVTLTPVPDTGSAFTGWSGACTGTGACIVTMDVARIVTATFSRTQSIAFAQPPDRTYGDAPFILSPTSSSGLTVTLTTSTPAACTVSVTTVTIVGAGTCTVTADQAGDASTLPAPPVSRSFNVAKAAQSIGFGALGNKVLGSAPFPVNATGGASGNAVTFSPSTPATCTVSGSTVTLVSTGTCTITANQAGNANFLDAAPVSRSFAVLPLGSLAITSPDAATFTVNRSGTFTVTATGSPSPALSMAGALPPGVTFTSASGALAGTPSFGSAGIYPVTFRASNGVASDSVQSFTLTVARIAQSIAFGTLANRQLGSSPFPVSATGGASGNAVAFASATPSICTVSGNTVTLVAAGTCTITASQPGNADYAEAAAVSQSFTVGQNLATLTVTPAGAGSGTVTSSPAGITCGISCSAAFAPGTLVQLTASPSAGMTFAGWAGDCTGTGACSVTMDATRNVRATFTSPSASVPRLGNISTRMQVLTGDDVMIGGFIIGGSQPKTVVVRARGPSLAPFGIPNFLADPRLDLYAGQAVIATNDDWQQAANAAQALASGFAPADPKEAAIHTTLPPGPYTAIVSGVGGTTGVGIVEVFEVDLPQAPLVNISTRGQVLTSDNVMIGGFIITGDSPQTVIIRARGPSLAPFGITNFLADPVLQLFSGQAQVAVNDNWQEAANAAEIQARGFAPASVFESAILVTLGPGAYTAIVSGAGGATGVGIIEVFAQ